MGRLYSGSHLPPARPLMASPPSPPLPTPPACTPGLPAAPRRLPHAPKVGGRDPRAERPGLGPLRASLPCREHGERRARVSWARGTRERGAGRREGKMN